MSDEDKLHNFISGMQGWAQNEIRRQKVKDLPSAIAAADALVDFCTASLTSDPISSYKSKKKEKGKDWKKDNQKQDGNDKGKGKMNASSSKANKPTGGEKVCWTCQRPGHQARNCPNQGKISALRAEEEKQGKGQEVAAYVNLLRMLNTLACVTMADDDENSAKEEVTYVKATGDDLDDAYSTLLYVDLKIGNKSVVTMVDTGATHTFVASRIVQEYGLQVTKCPTKMKAMNSKAQPGYGVVLDVPMILGHWSEKFNMTVVPLDDFNVLLGIDFLKKKKVTPIPHLDGLMFMGESSPDFVKGIMPYEVNNENAGIAALISAIAFEKGLKRGEETYLVSLVEVKPDVHIEVPDCVANLLKEFKDVMPPELPRELPQRREIDYRIELISGLLLPAQPPYRMLPMELTELRKQLFELLDARLIQPSKAPYGAPILFHKK
ncbi:uncharacterized protein LOC142169758 [Nicotiana tabacum]|uniref:Uncharacterized protein LOC142169758 n=1 Tax=Nicotiana tabacum TaxID=4097 RepID=A0AC58SS23_TOBAC